MRENRPVSSEITVPRPVGARPYVAGIDSSTQSCKVLVVDPATGHIVRSGQAPHPDGTQCPPDAWWDALQRALDAAGGLDDVAAVSVGGQQHGLVALDASGAVLRPAMLWNDTLAAESASDLVRELGAEFWAEATGLVPVASITVAKVRWLADHEPENAARLAAIALPHDWLTWKLSGAVGLDTLVTDRSDASGTGYFDPVGNAYRRDLLAHALRRDADAIVLPRVLGPSEAGPRGDAALGDFVLGPGCGDNAGGALGLGLSVGQSMVSIGTSGVVAAVSDVPTRNASGIVTGFADATGRFLPLSCTLNGARISEATRAILGVDYDEFDRLALASEPGAGGLTHVPFLEGERTPNLPHATGSLFGMTLASMTRENMARAAVEGTLLLLAAALERFGELGVHIDGVKLMGGGAKSAALRAIAPGVLGVPVEVPRPGEYVALGAARQAAWVLSGEPEPPTWELEGVARFTGDDLPWLRERYADAVVRSSR